MNESQSHSDTETTAGQHRLIKAPAAVEEPQSEGEHEALPADSADPMAALTRRERMDVLRGLPSFGFQIIRDSRTETPGS